MIASLACRVVHLLKRIVVLPILIGRRMAWLVVSCRVFIRASAARYWDSLAPYRYLLACDSHSLPSRSRLQRWGLGLFLAFPDWYYRKRYRMFGEALARLPGQRNGLSPRGLTLMIGALGPGGAERQLVLTATGLAKRRYGPLDLVCVFLRHETERFFLPHLESVGVSVSELDCDPTSDAKIGLEPYTKATRSLPNSLYDVAHYIRTLAARQPAVLHLWLDEINIKGGLAAVAIGIPRIVLGLRSLPPINFALHQPYMREGYCWLAKQPNVVLLNNSAAGARAYENWLGLPTGTIRTTHNGFDFSIETISRYQLGRTDYRARHNIPGMVPVIGTVIRFSEEKRPLLWLKIAAAVRRHLPEVHFLIVGDGPMRAQIEELAAQEDLRGAVHLIGHQTEAMAAIASMDLFLLTSRAEGLPNVLVEAQALGVPVVSTDAGGAAETMEHGLTGWVLERDNWEHVAHTLLRLLGDEAWRSKARLEAPAFVRKHFCVERMLEETLATYGDAIHSF